MTDQTTGDTTDQGPPNRRRFLAGAVVATGAAWAAPAIRSTHNIAWAAGTVQGEHYGGNYQTTFELPKNRTVEFVLVGGGGGSGQNTWNVNNAAVVSGRVQEGAGSNRIRHIAPGDGKAARGGAGTRLVGTFDTGSSPMTIGVWTGSGGTGAPRLNGAGGTPGNGTHGGLGGAGYSSGGNGGLGLYRSSSNLWNTGDGYLNPGGGGFFDLYGGCGGGGGGASAIWSVGSGDKADGADLEIIAPGGGGGGGAGSARNGERPRDFDQSTGSGYRISSGGGHGGDAVVAVGPQSVDVNGSTGETGIAGLTGGGSAATGAGAGGAGGSSGAGGGGVGANASDTSGYYGGGGGGGGGGWSGGAGGGAGVASSSQTILADNRRTPGGGGGGSGSMRIHGANVPVNVVDQGGNEPGPPVEDNLSNEQRAGRWGARDTSAQASEVPAQGWNGNPGYFRIYLQ